MSGRGRPKGARALRAARAREPQLVEEARRVLALRGPSSSPVSLGALRDLVQMLKPQAKALSRKNPVLPFEDASSLEFLCAKNECSAFAYASHNKKRPHNLVLGRTFDGHVLDMVELGIDPDSFRALADCGAGSGAPKRRPGTPPLLVFAGEQWARVPALGRLRSLVLDLLAPRNAERLVLKGVDHVICCTATAGSGDAAAGGEGAGGAGGAGGAEEMDDNEGAGAGAGAGADASAGAGAGAGAGGAGGGGGAGGAYGGGGGGGALGGSVVHWRAYSVLFRASGSRVPRVELVPHGPQMDLTLRRTQFASAELAKESLRVPHQVKAGAKRPKNVSVDEFGETLGRVHMERQDFSKLELRKSKAIRGARKAGKAAAAAAGAGGAEGAGDVDREMDIAAAAAEVEDELDES